MSKKICKILTRCCCVAAACCLILAGAAGPLTAYAAEGETYTLSGTWLVNETLSLAETSYLQPINFTVTSYVPIFGCEVTLSCGHIEVHPTVDGFLSLGYEATGSSVDLSGGGFDFPLFISVYIGLDGEGWDFDSFGAGVRTITFTEEQEVSPEFYEWFTANAVQVDVPTRSFLDNFSAVGTGIWSGVSGVANTIVSNPLLLLTTGFLFLGGCIGILGRFLSRS